MTPKEFIIANSEKFSEAVSNGYDIRMEEAEIFEWMERYRNADFKRERQDEAAKEIAEMPIEDFENNLNRLK